MELLDDNTDNTTDTTTPARKVQGVIEKARYLDPERKYSDKQLAFLEAMAGEACGNIPKAIKIAGYNNVSSRDVVPYLTDELIAIAEHILAYNAPKAAFGMVGVLDDPTALGAKNSIVAAKEVLDRVGIVKKEKLEVTADEGSGLFILPAKTVASNHSLESDD